MKKRPAARILLTNSAQQLLLFYTSLKGGYWFTLGGAVEPGETFEETACREVFEETGISISHPGPQIYAQTTVFTLPDATLVEADERYFSVQTKQTDLKTEQWSQAERTYIKAYRWWAAAELAEFTGTVWPANLPDILVDAGVW